MATKMARGVCRSAAAEVAKAMSTTQAPRVVSRSEMGLEAVRFKAGLGERVWGRTLW